MHEFIISMLEAKDNVKVRIMRPDGKYQFIKKTKNESLIDTHTWMIENWKEEKEEGVLE